MKYATDLEIPALRVDISMLLVIDFATGIKDAFDMFMFTELS